MKLSALTTISPLVRHLDVGNVLVHNRKLQLPALVSGMLKCKRKSVQKELDEFFAHLKDQGHLVSHVSEQPFAKARAKLSTTAIPDLTDWLVARADPVPRSHRPR